MALVVNHNLMAANSARNLNINYGKLQRSTQRLSSGLRINSAADDAAGLAIRELMRADIATLNQGVRNANDAISLIQVADGALAVISGRRHPPRLYGHLRDFRHYSYSLYPKGQYKCEDHHRWSSRRGG